MRKEYGYLDSTHWQGLPAVLYNETEHTNLSF
jgi:hypothetical protein